MRTHKGGTKVLIEGSTKVLIEGSTKVLRGGRARNERYYLRVVETLFGFAKAIVTVLTENMERTRHQSGEQCWLSERNVVQNPNEPQFLKERM